MQKIDPDKVTVLWPYEDSGILIGRHADTLRNLRQKLQDNMVKSANTLESDPEHATITEEFGTLLEELQKLYSSVGVKKEEDIYKRVDQCMGALRDAIKTARKENTSEDFYKSIIRIQRSSSNAAFSKN